MSTDDLLDWLEQWYTRHCDGEWEHEYGVDIGTLDNPGWRIRLRVDDELPSFDRVEWEEGDDEWLHAWLEDGQLNVACGPCCLRRALTLVREALER